MKSKLSKIFVAIAMLLSFITIPKVEVKANDLEATPFAAVYTYSVYKLFEHDDYNFEYDVDSYMSFDIRINGEYKKSNGAIIGATMTGSLENVSCSDSKLTARVTATSNSYTNSTIRVSVKVSYYYNGHPSGSETFIIQNVL